MQDDTGAFGPADDEPGESLPSPDFAADEPAAEPARPLTVPRPETGELRVDAALSLLDELGARMAPRPAVPPRRDGS